MAGRYLIISLCHFYFAGEEGSRPTLHLTPPLRLACFFPITFISIRAIDLLSGSFAMTLASIWIYTMLASAFERCALDSIKYFTSCILLRQLLGSLAAVEYACI